MQTDGNSGFHFLLKLLMMILSFMMLFIADVVDMMGSGAKGLVMLSMISTTNLFFVTVAAISLFCTCITEEKEHNTLGVMMMTGISPFGFLVGKLLSRLYIVVQLILLQIPLIVIARTLGGLSMDQILAHLVYFISIIFVMSQIGMVFSIVSSKSSHAIAFTIIFLVLLSVLPCTDSATFLSYYFQIFETGFNEGAFAQPVVYLLTLSVGLFFLGVFIFNGFTYGESGGAFNREVTPLSARSRKRFGSSALFQKDFRYFTGGFSGIVFRFTALCVLVVLAFTYQRNEIFYGLAIGWLYIESFYYSQMMVKYEKSNGTLSTLGVLPLKSREILNQKYLSFVVSILPSLLAFFAISISQGRDPMSNFVSFLLVSLAIYSHFTIALLCSMTYERMSLVVSVLFILLFSLAFFVCPIGWLLFLPSLVILSVNVYEKFAQSFART